MKKFLSMIVPILVFLLLMRLGSGILATGTVNPSSILIIFAAAILLILSLRPKNNRGKSASDLEKKARGEFAKDAFAGDPQLEARFQAAVKDYNSNMPKAALAKLTKLADQCTGEKEIYAVSMATAQLHTLLGKPLLAIREYTRALGIHPTPEVAMDLGSSHQRLGNLEKARDSYEFAIDLDPENLEARSRIATTYVADHEFETALEHARMVLDQDEHHASALATTAICYGVLHDSVMCSYYTRLAVENGYSQKKIEETVSTLRKKVQ